MRKFVTSIVLAFLLLAATIVPFVPAEKAYSLLPETESFIISAQKDSFLKQGSQSHNEGANLILDLQSSDKHRPVVAFDQNQIVNLLNGRQLSSAILKLYVNDNGNNWGPGGNNIGAYRLLTDWQEGDGWNLGNNIPGAGAGATWACPIDSDISNNQINCATQWDGGSFQSPATSSVLVTNNLVNQWISFNVTSDVKAFLDGSAVDYGWLIKKNSESLNGDITLASKEASANNPILEITVLRPEVVLANEYLNLVAGLDTVGRGLNETVITQELVDRMSSDLARISEIVTELQNLGFDGEASAARVGQKMVGTVKFYNLGTSESLFETQIPEGALGIFAAMGLRNEFSEEEVEIPFDLLATSLSLSFNLAQAITNFEDNDIATDFVLASIAAFHPSTGNTFTLVWSVGGKVGRAIATSILRCFGSGDCKFAVDRFLTGPGDDKFLEWAFPSFRVTGTKFNDMNGNGVRESEELGISGWLFVVSTSSAPRIFEDFSNQTGIFVIEGIYPRTTQTLVVTEQLQNGWEATTPGGEIQEIFFNVTAIPFNPIPGTPTGVFQPAPRTFGNFQLGSISGFVYSDANVLGQRDSEDQGLAGWTITLKNATTGNLIRNAITDTSGLYIFENLTVGEYRVEEVLQGGYTQTEPLDGSYLINIQSGTFSIGNDFGNRIAPQVIFEEKFDDGISGWTQTVCQRGSGQTCFISTVTTPTPVPSPPNWGASGLLDTTPGTCTSPVSSRHSKTFTVPTAGNYEVKSVMFGSICSGCTVKAQLYIDSVRILERAGQRLGVTPPQPPVTLSAVVSLTAGQHSIQIGMTSDLACSGTFQGEFDDISITRVSTIQTTQSQSSPPPGGPYYSLELNQTSVNATAPDAATVRLEVHWDPGYEPEPVLIDVMSNSTYTGISHTVTSAYNTTTYQAFDITFDISPEVEVGQYEYIIFVNEEDTDDSLAEVVQLNIE
jgi:hypothetical protein